MLKKFIVLFSMVVSALACNLLSAPQEIEVVNTEPAATVVPTSEETSGYITTGTYTTQTYENGAVCVLEIKGEPDLKFYVNCNRGAPSYNQGVLSGGFKITAPNVGSFKTDRFGNCELRFEFNETGVVVTQTGTDFECGFGNGVTATGNYTFQNDQTPNIP
ncbi:MAG: hypothetical protein OHK003_06310 [Anaerolineales bacterium]